MVFHVREAGPVSAHEPGHGSLTLARIIATLLLIRSRPIYLIDAERYIRARERETHDTILFAADSSLKFIVDVSVR